MKNYEIYQGCKLVQALLNQENDFNVFNKLLSIQPNSVKYALQWGEWQVFEIDTETQEAKFWNPYRSDIPITDDGKYSLLAKRFGIPIEVICTYQKGIDYDVVTVTCQTSADKISRIVNNQSYTNSNGTYQLGHQSHIIAPIGDRMQVAIRVEI